jgi:hypothetical protein
MSEHFDELKIIKTSPLATSIPTPLVVTKVKAAYKVWHDHLINLNRIDRYTLGAKIDEIFLALMENVFRSSFASDRFEKLNFISAAISKCDLLKFMLQLAWESKYLDHKKYGSLCLDTEEIGRMLGGWKKTVGLKTPAK